ncbi:PAS domain-containing protein [Siccirubricoccus sp. G192]|uniref:PAS domain-containing protein n=1 Tax=Siccirubricoccus sp. G192 TaxID=2849651 RepID=UPI001C2C57E9|nr:PAS domain-containing protein [Siccirubricoccus sp. G192]MBV1799861.1 PAS domain-containing protein [Siccirubricoccus sp. G192]
MAQALPPLRFILAAAFGSIALLAALATSLLACGEASRGVQAELLEDLAGDARQFAEMLDRGIFARWRDLQVAAGLPLMRDPATPPETRREILARLQDTTGDYALLAFVAPDGRVLADSRRLLEGQDLSGQDILRRALDGPVVADVHPAPVLAGRPGQPLRLVDLATPVHDAAGQVVGVILAQLDWRWAIEAVAPAGPADPHMLILRRDGEVLAGPAGLLGRILALPPGGQGRLALDGAGLDGPGPEGRRDFAVAAPTRGHRDYPGLGWVVVAWEDAARALAPMRAMQRQILLLGGGAALLAALLGWAAAWWLARPLRQLAGAAARLEQDADAALPHPAGSGTGFAEAAGLAAALDAMLRRRREAETALRASETRFRLAQRAGQIGCYDYDIASGRVLRTEECLALSGLPPAAAADTWSSGDADWLARLHPEDRARMSAETAAAFARPGPYAFEFRLLWPDGGLRWLADRGEVLAGPDGRPARALGALRDVTARRATEDALREGEARLRLAQEAAGIGSWDLDPGSGRQVWSAQQYRLFGLDPAAPPPDSADWFRLVHPEDRARVQAMQATALAAGSREFATEFRIRRATDGMPRWIAARGRIEVDAAGRPARMLGVNLDITEARMREQRLAEREAELRALIEANPIGVLRGDVHGRILEANDALLRLAGRNRAALEAGDLRWDAMTPAEWRPADAAGLAEARAKGVCTSYEKEYLRPDGSRVPILIGYALTGEAREQIVAFILDLTDRKRAEAALLRAKEGLEQRVAERTAELAAREAELRRIYDRTPAAFHSVDAEGRLIRVSEQWLAFLGYTHEREVLGRRTGEFMPGDSAARWEAALAALQAPGDEVREVEYRMLRRNGERVEVLVRSRAEHDAAGRFLCSYSVLIDLTARNQAEARLREAQKLEALGRIAGGVAHDFNNLLQVMTGALHLVEAKSEDPARVRRYARAALEAAERGADVTRRMLAFARRDALRTGPVEVAAVLRDLAALLHGPLGPGIALEIAVPPDLPPVQADRMQLDLVLFNLALNARDAMPGDGRLRLSATAETVGPGHPQGLRPGRYLRLAVEDSGAGMDAATLARATEPFFTTRETGQASGLGLSMAHGFAVQSGGALALASTPGQGTVVTLWLPVAAAASQPAPGLPAPDPSALRGEARAAGGGCGSGA